MSRVTHVITGLAREGAQLALYRLLAGIDRSRFDLDVVSLTQDGPVAAMIRDLEIPVLSVGMRGFSATNGPALLVRHLRRRRPHVVQSWMYHADLLGGLAARATGVPNVCWGLRQLDVSPSNTRPATRAVAHAGARLSRWIPDAIVCCAEATRRVHEDMGYDSSRMRLIHNGFEVPDLLRPSPLREQVGIPPTATLIGRIARDHPHKDIPTFLQAAAILKESSPSVHFLLCGDALEPANGWLVQMVKNLGLKDHTTLLGKRTDMDAVYGALDIACSSSSSEGLPNVVGEAMARGIPNAVTDVGDSAFLVGDTGWIAPAHDPSALALQLAKAVALPPEERLRMGSAARQRIIEHFSMDRMVTAYEDLYVELMISAATRQAAASDPNPQQEQQ